VNVAIITYDAPHLKTEQVILNLAARVSFGLNFFALPFRPRPARTPLFQHRPDQATGMPSAAVARFVGASFMSITAADEIPVDGFEYYVITGAGLLPPGFVRATRGRVINAHPGVIPLARGLDSFKWSIVDQLPLGNTLHFIDEEADAGEVLAIRPTALFETDSLETLARRHYEQEIDLLSHFDLYLGEAKPATSLGESRPARKRMSREQEERLLAAFVRYRSEQVRKYTLPSDVR
jgi:phosphoribosylglycinamide formyltransferase 1